MTLALLIFFLVFPITVFLRWEKNWRPGLLWSVFPFFAVCVVNYSVVLLSAHLAQEEARARVESFDVDRNGLLNGAEINAESSEAIRNATNDTGRTLAPITGVPVTLVYVGVSHLIAHYWHYRRKSGRGNSHNVVHSL